MTVEEKKAFLVKDFARFTLGLCQKLADLNFTSLYDLLRLNRQLLKKKGLDDNELHAISMAFYRLGFTFYESTESLVKVFASRWEKHGLNTPVDDVLPQEYAKQLKLKDITRLGDIYRIYHEGERKKVEIQEKNRAHFGPILRTYEAETVQPWVDFAAAWEKERVKLNGTPSNS